MSREALYAYVPKVLAARTTREAIHIVEEAVARFPDAEEAALDLVAIAAQMAILRLGSRVPSREPDG